MLFLTSGEAGGHGRSEAETRELREGEAAAAAAVLGVAGVEFWRQPDGALTATELLAQRLRARIAELRASTVYVTHAGEMHPDHRAAAEIVRLAVAGLPAGERPDVLTYEIWTPLQRLDEIVDITGHVEAKRAAIRAHASQCDVLAFDEAMLALNRYRGEMHCWPEGEYAEVFGRMAPMIHHVFANRSNIGDWLSAQGHPAPTRPAARWTEHLLRRAVRADTAGRAVDGRARDDLIVIGGGGLFMDYFEPFWTGLASSETPARVCIWGVGYCDLKLEPSRAPVDLLRRVGRAPARCTVVSDELTRDPDSGLDPAGHPLPEPGRRRRGRRPVRGCCTSTTTRPPAPRPTSAWTRSAARSRDCTGRRYPRRPTTASNPGGARVAGGLLDRYAACDVVLSSALHGCIIARGDGPQAGGRLRRPQDRRLHGGRRASRTGCWT